jgi:hypothetical protein
LNRTDLATVIVAVFSLALGSGPVARGQDSQAIEASNKESFVLVSDVDDGSLFGPADFAAFQPPTMQAPPRRTPGLSARPASARLASVPNMFGDFFGGGGIAVVVQPSPVIITQIWNDGVPRNLFVLSTTGTAGADPNDPMAGIRVFDTDASGPLITQSFGLGQDTSADGVNDRFSILEPVNSAPLPGPGTVVFLGGEAVFVNLVGPNTETNASNGTSGDGWNLIFSHEFAPAAFTVVLPGGGGTAVRQVKIAENNSPEPRDRVFFNYNFFNDVDSIGDVNRYTFGVEKTFFCGSQSLELRVPFAATLNSDQFANGTSLRETEFGNLALIWKILLLERDCWLLTGGLGATFPTADDARLFLDDTTQILHIHNRSVHLLPYLALLGAMGERWFTQVFLQLDIDTSGSVVEGDVDGGPLPRIGVLQDSTLLFVDVGVGYWLYENPCACRLTGAAAVVELHYATTLQDSDIVAGNGLAIGNASARYDQLDLTVGVDFKLGERTSIRPGVVVPLRDGDDRLFDYEAQLQVNVSY